MIDATQRRAADAWFLDRGLPAVLRPGALVRRLWPRSATRARRVRVFMANSALVVAVTGKHTIDIYGHPTRTEWFVLALVVLVLPVAVFVGPCQVRQVAPCPGTWFGIHVPVPQTVGHVSLFVAVLSGLYFTVSTSVDPIYRERFFDPLISDLAISLAGRDAYLELERQRP
jgi:hypothetical protein